MKQQKISRDLLNLAVLTLITALTWVTFDVYRALTNYTIPEVLEEQMLPLNPKLDQEKINRLKERLRTPEEELANIPAPEPPEPTEDLESTESATISGEL